MIAAGVGYSSQEGKNSDAIKHLLRLAENSGNQLLMDAGNYVILNSQSPEMKVTKDKEFKKETRIYWKHLARCSVYGSVTVLALQADQSDSLRNLMTCLCGFGCIKSGYLSYQANQNCRNLSKLLQTHHQAKAQLRERLVAQMGEEEFAKLGQLSTSKEDVQRLAELFKEEEWFEVVAEPESEEKEVY